MPDNVWDDPDAKEWLEDAARDMIPKMKSSALSVTIFSGKVDPKLCVELGAAILLDKPIILLATEDAVIPRSLEKIAAEIVRGSALNETTRTKMMAAISRHLPHQV